MRAISNQWKPFEEAREYVHSLDPKNFKEWREWCESGQEPEEEKDEE